MNYCPFPIQTRLLIYDLFSLSLTLILLQYWSLSSSLFPLISFVAISFSFYCYNHCLYLHLILLNSLRLYLSLAILKHDLFHGWPLSSVTRKNNKKVSSLLLQTLSWMSYCCPIIVFLVVLLWGTLLTIISFVDRSCRRLFSNCKNGVIGVYLCPWRMDFTGQVSEMMWIEIAMSFFSAHENY